MYTHGDATNAAAKVPIAAVEGLRHAVSWIAWSYTGVPTSGTLQVLDAGDVIFDIDIILACANMIHFGDSALIGTPGADMTIELTGGGLTLKGKVNVCYRDI